MWTESCIFLAWPLNIWILGQRPKTFDRGGCIDRIPTGSFALGYQGFNSIDQDKNSPGSLEMIREMPLPSGKAVDSQRAGNSVIECCRVGAAIKEKSLSLQRDAICNSIDKTEAYYEIKLMLMT